MQLYHQLFTGRQKTQARPEYVNLNSSVNCNIKVEDTGQTLCAGTLFGMSPVMEKFGMVTASVYWRLNAHTPSKEP